MTLEAERFVASDGVAQEKRVTILGSTGSIGCSTLDLVARDPGSYSVAALTANRNVELLSEQARTFRPALAVIADETRYAELKQALAGTGIEVAAGEEALKEAASVPADLVMAGIVGAAGLAPTLEAVRQGADIALANKECLVSAGPLFLKEVLKSGVELLPVDSEHNAIFQVLEQDRLDAVDKIILTASGGPFRTATREVMEAATPAEAVKHPQWDMGAKISVDSATLMNKGLELIEAFYLFPVGLGRIDVIIHPQSIIHSMVGYVDGSVLAQLGSPDMRTPISYALAWPNRMPTPSKRLDLAEIASLTFEAPDHQRFPALELCRSAIERGGLAPTILNAANEVAVAAFLAGEIGFLSIVALVEETLDAMATEASHTPGSLEDVYHADGEARRVAATRLPAHAK